MNPKVSVCITAYNHEKYISQALDSVLMQKTDFDFEVLIGEDDSSDNTRKIVKEYARHHPGKIRLFLNDRKNVIYINGRPTGRWNFINNLENAIGKYISLLDGDDFWTDPYKLQKQIDFLAINPSYATCIHNVTVLYEDPTIHHHPHFSQDLITARHMYPKPNTSSILEDLLHGNFIPTPSVMFRSGIFDKFPLWFYGCSMGDWPLHVLNTKYGGPIGYIDEIMGVYRVHTQSMWSSSDRIENLLNSISSAECIKRELACKYSRIVEKTIIKWHIEIIKLVINNKKLPFSKLLENKILFKPSFTRILRFLRILIYILSIWLRRIFIKK